MSRTLINALIVGLAIFTFGSGLGTQVAAHLLDYQKALGDPLLTLGELPIYWPFALFDWRAQSGDGIRDIFSWPMICAFAGAVMGAATAVRMMLVSDGPGGADYAAPIRTWLDETPSSWGELASAGGAGFAVMLLFWATACWIVAGYFDFAPRFGQPLIAFGPVRLYGPFAFFGWQEALAQDNPSIFAFANLFMLGGVGAGLFVALQLSAGAPLLPANPRGRHIVHGGWADARDIKRAGLLGRSTGMVLGVLSGAIGQRPITYNGPGHALILGATRTGKGRGIVLPTLLSWEGSIVALDPKGELADGDARLGFPGTAGYRAQASHIIRFAPTRLNSAKFNPLLEVRRGDNEVRDVQNIVDILTAPTRQTNEAPFWRNSASSLLVGIILDVLHTAADGRKNFAEVRARLARMDETAEAMRGGWQSRDGRVCALSTPHPIAQQVATAYLAMEERTQSNVRATADSYLTVFADSLVAENTAASTFRLADLVGLDRPLTLYLQPPPSDMDRLMPLMRLIVGLIVRALTEDKVADSLGRLRRHRTLLLLDEFPLLGALPGFERAMGLMAGYDIQAMLVCQSINSIRGVYGRDNAIIHNCDVITSFGVNDPATAEVICKLGGDVIEMIPQVTRHRRGGLDPQRQSHTWRDDRRPLMQTGDPLRLPPDQMLIFKGGCRPIRARRLQVDAFPLFANRLIADAPQSETLTEDHDWKRAGANDKRKPRDASGFDDTDHEGPNARPMRNVTPGLVLLPPPEKPGPKRRGPRRSKGV
jgi:type IV secretion system protein VirD4